jgi:hypothetical protein
LLGLGPSAMRPLTHCGLQHQCGSQPDRCDSGQLTAHPTTLHLTFLSHHCFHSPWWGQANGSLYRLAEKVLSSHSGTELPLVSLEPLATKHPAAEHLLCQVALWMQSCTWILGDGVLWEGQDLADLLLSLTLGDSGWSCPWEPRSHLPEP